MDSAKSLYFINDFEQRIKLAASDDAHERFVREFVCDVAHDCPVPVLTELATALLNIRKAELRRTGERN